MTSQRFVRLPILLFGVLALSCGAPPARTPLGQSGTATPTSARGSVYTTDEGANALSRIDLQSGQVRQIALPIRPHNVQTSADAQRVFVVGMMPSPGAGQEEHVGKMAGQLLVIDAASFDIAKASRIEIGPHPAHVIVDASASRAFVTDSETSALQIVDLNRRSVVALVPTGRFPHGLRMSPDGREIAVANVEDDSVSIVDPTAAKELVRIPVGKAPVQVAYTPDGKRLFVSLRDEDAVAVVDLASRRKTGSIAVGDGPIQVFMTPDGRYVYVANEGTPQAPANTVSVIDTGSLRVIRTIPAGRGPHGLVATSDGSRVFVSNRFDDTVSEINVMDQTVARTFRVGDEPTGITFGAAK